jgi:hypothetical protein
MSRANHRRRGAAQGESTTTAAASAAAVRNLRGFPRSPQKNVILSSSTSSSLSIPLSLSLSLVCACVYQRYSKNPMRNLVSNAAHTAAQRQTTRTDRHNFRFKLFLVSAPTSSSSSRRRKKERKNTIQTTRISPSLMASVGFVPLQLFTHCQRAARWMHGHQFIRSFVNQIRSCQTCEI